MVKERRENGNTYNQTEELMNVTSFQTQQRPKNTFHWFSIKHQIEKVEIEVINIIEV